MAVGIGDARQRRAAVAIAVIKGVHTVIFLGIASAVLHTLYSGLTGRVSRLTKVSIAVVLGECLVFVLNRGRCPLTDVVEDLGCEHGSVSDIFLPTWFAERIPVIYTTLFAIGLAALGLRRLAGCSATQTATNVVSCRKPVRSSRRRSQCLCP